MKKKMKKGKRQGPGGTTATVKTGEATGGTKYPKNTASPKTRGKKKRRTFESERKAVFGLGK